MLLLRAPGWTLASVASLLALACSARPPLPADVVGRYVLSFPRISDTLRLGPDGTFTRTYIPANGPALVDTGSWRLTAGGRVVSLFGFPNRWQDRLAHGGARPDSAAPSAIGFAFRSDLLGRHWLDFRPEFGWTYKRVARIP